MTQAPPSQLERVKLSIMVRKRQKCSVTVSGLELKRNQGDGLVSHVEDDMLSSPAVAEED